MNTLTQKLEMLEKQVVAEMHESRWRYIAEKNIIKARPYLDKRGELVRRVRNLRTVIAVNALGRNAYASIVKKFDINNCTHVLPYQDDHWKVYI